MADTARSRAALAALLLDNTDGEITAQVLRDFLVSALGCYGGLALAANAVAQTVGTTPTKVVNWSAASAPAHDGVSADSAAGTLTATVAGDYLATLAVSGLADAGRLVKLAVYKNGVLVPGTKAARLSSSGTDVGGWSASMIVSLAVNDVVAAYASSDQNATSVTLSEGALTISRIG